MKIAMTDMDICWEDKKANKTQCEAMILEASEYKADAIIFPEMTLTGFSLDVQKIQSQNNEDVEFFKKLAIKYNIAIGFGYATWNGMKGRNHFCFIEQTGKILTDYEKIHPFTYGGESSVFEGGNRISHFEWKDMVCGMFICYDLRFGEAFWQLPMETDVIFLIANWPASRLDHWYTLLKARAIELQCYVIGVNRVGEGGGLKYEQSSVAYSPTGERIEETSDVWNRYVEIDKAKRLRYIEKFPTKQDRRADIYFE